MKLIITGAGGFLGSRLVSFYNNTHTVLGLTHADLDFTDATQVSDRLLSFSPDIVIHCGAISDVSTCAQNPELSMSVNVEGTRNLARASVQVGSRFIFCSSDQVYFSQQNTSLTPHKEEEHLSPLPLYGQHKLLAENACQQEQPDSVILRLTWMYDKLSHPETQKGRSNLAVNLERALHANTTLTFSATDYRGVTNVQTVIHQMEKAWQLPAGIYNYGSTNHTNMYETVHHILHAFGKTELLRISDGGTLRNLTLDTSKVESYGITFPNTADGVIEFLKQV